jgi:hypothetical protein
VKARQVVSSRGNTACAFCATAFLSLLHAIAKAIMTSTEMGEETTLVATSILRNHLIEQMSNRYFRSVPPAIM